MITPGMGSIDADSSGSWAALRNPILRDVCSVCSLYIAILVRDEILPIHVPEDMTAQTGIFKTIDNED
jgi:hypothetical protein